MKALIFLPMILSACAAAQRPSPCAPLSEPLQSMVAPARPVPPERYHLSKYDRELVASAREALERVRKRLDWLNGRSGP